MISIILFIMFVISVAVGIDKNNKKEKQINELTSQLREFDGKLPCYAPCFICQLTGKQCVGKKLCKVYCNIKK